jgi:hypothetical protein
VPRKVISQYYQIKLNRTRQSCKFKTAQNVYNVTFKPLPYSSSIRRLFRDILQNVKRKMQTQSNDYLRVNIDHPSLDSPLWIEFTQAKNLTEQKILNKIEAVQQSKKEFLSTDWGTQLDFFHVKYPEGRGCTKFKHLHLNKEKFKKKKQAIVQIHNPWDYLCLPRAIVVTRLHAQKPKVPDLEWEEKWLQMRKGDAQALGQKRQALALMESAGCDTTQPCGPEEWSKLQHVLAPEFRLKIFQFKVNT